MVNQNRFHQQNHSRMWRQFIVAMLVVILASGSILQIISQVRGKMQDNTQQDSTALNSTTASVCDDLPINQQPMMLCDSGYNVSSLVQDSIIPQIDTPAPMADLQTNPVDTTPQIATPNAIIPNRNYVANATQRPWLVASMVFMLLMGLASIIDYVARRFLRRDKNASPRLVYLMVFANLSLLLFAVVTDDGPRSPHPNTPPPVYEQSDNVGGIASTPVPSILNVTDYEHYNNNIIPAEPLILSDDLAVGLPSIEATSAIIGIDGGVLEDTSGKLRVEFDAGAVQGDVEVKLSPIAFPRDTLLPINHTLIFAPFELIAEDTTTGEAVTYFEPEIIVETEQVTDILGTRDIEVVTGTPRVRIIITPFDDSNSYLNPDDNRARHNYLHYLDEDNREWVSMLSPYNADKGAYITETDHFTTFAFLNEARPGDPSLVFLDPAHGGSENGGFTNVPANYFAYEKNFNLNIARRTAQRIENCGVDVRLTRNRDEFISVYQRADAINWYQPDMAMGIAFNVVSSVMTDSSGTGSGTEIWRISNEVNNALAEDIMSGVTNATDLPRRTINSGYASFIQDDLIAPTIPFVHAELAFMDNFRDRAILDNAPQLFADGIYNGVRNFLIRLGIDPDECAEIPPSPLRDIFSRFFGVPPWSPEHPANFGGDPVNLQTGGFIYQQRDLYIPSPGMDMVIERTYNHQDRFAGGSLGLGWSSSLDTFIYVNENGDIDWRTQDGRVVVFSESSNDIFEPQPGSFEQLYTPESGLGRAFGASVDEYVIVKSDDTRMFYRLYGDSVVGQLTRVERSSGAIFRYSYSARGALTTIEDSAGRIYPVQVDTDGRITSVRVPTGDTITYTYSDDGLLLEVNGLDGRTMRYTYDTQDRMYQIYNSNGQLILTNFYDEFNRVDYQLDPNQNRLDYQYQPNANTSRVIDANGQVEVIRYDENRRPVERITPLGTTRYTYDDAWNLIEIVRADGSKIQREFDASGNMTAKILPNGQRTEYTYNDTNYVLTQIDPLGATTLFDYDEDYNLVRITEADGDVTSMTYNVYGQVLTTTYADGAVERYTYQTDSGQVETITNPLGDVTRFTYNVMGHLIAVRDALGRITTFTTNNSGDVLTKTLPNGGIYTYTYDGNSNLLTETDPLGAVTTFTYTPFNQVAATTDSLGRTTSYTYNAVNDLIEVEDALGRTTQYYYNTDGYLLVMIDALSQVTRHTRDPLGRLLAVVDAAGNTRTNIFDESGRLIEEIDELGNSTFREYNLRDQVITITDRRGNDIEMTYDALSGNLTRRAEPEGVVYHFEYDNRDRIVRVTQPDGTILKTEYDLVGRVIVQYDALNNTERYVFDSVGNLVEEIDRHGNITTMTYTILDNPETITYATGDTETFAYDLKGQRISFTDANGHATTYERDSEGQIISEIDALGFVTEYEYDLVGNQITIINALGDIETYEYDALDRIIAYSDPLGHTTTFTYSPLGELTSETDANGHTTQYGLDERQRRVSITDPENNETLFTFDAEDNLTAVIDSLGNSIEYHYDDRGRLIERTDGRGFTTFYAYNVMDQRTQVTDANQHTLVYTYDDNQRLISVTSAEGHVTHYTYDPNANILTVTDGNDNTISRLYDARNRLLTSTNALGDTSYYSYDGVGNLISQTDEIGRETRYSYDARNALIRVENPENEATLFSYDALGRQTTTTDQRNAVTTQVYDEAGRVVAMHDAEGGVTAYTYDAVGNILSITDPVGNETSYSYDRRNLRVSITDALGQTEYMTYDALGQQITMTNKRGFTTFYTYDEDGNLIATTDPLGGITTYGYDGVNNILSMTTPLGHTTTYTYDADNRLTSSTQPQGQQRLFVYDAANNLIVERDALGENTVFTYDANNNLVARTDALGHVESYHYDAAEQLVRSVDTLSNSTSYDYDQAGRLVRVIEPLDTVTHYTYDASGNLSSVRDANNNVRLQSFDLNGQLVQETDANGNVWSYSYDVAGNLINRIDAEGIQTNYRYDAINRLIETQYPDGSKIQYTYDANGNLVDLVDSAGTTQVTYDELDRLTSTTTSGREYDETIEYTYDEDSRLTSAIYPFMEITYDYNANGWLESLSTNDGNQISYSYDNTGHITVVDYPEASTSLVYDAVGRTTSVRTENNNDIISVRHYQYDADDNVLQQIEETADVATTRTFSYDALNRLQASTRGSQTITYTYDKMGNILVETTAVNDEIVKSVDYSYDAMYCLLQQGTTQYNCDANGNRTRMLEPQPDGMTLIVDYDYNYENELIEATARTVNLVDLGQNEWLGWSYPQTNTPDDVSYETLSPTLDQRGIPSSELHNQSYWTRWTRTITVSEAGTYTFEVLYNYGLSFEVDGVQYAYEQETGATPQIIEITVQLSAGDHQLSLLHGSVAGDDGRVALLSTIDADADNAETYAASYAYDGLRRLVSSEVSISEENNTFVVSMGYIHFGLGWDTLATQTIGLGINSVQYHYWGANRMVAMDTITDTSARQYAYFDMLGNVVATSSDDTISTFSYDDYGTLTAGDDTVTDYLWGGHYYESVTGFSYYGSRWYDSASQRWLTRDSYRGELDMPATQNQYAYVTANPLSIYDYYGFFGFSGGFKFNAFGWQGEVNASLNVGWSGINYQADADVAGRIFGNDVRARGAAKGNVDFQKREWNHEHRGQLVVNDNVVFDHHGKIHVDRNGFNTNFRTSFGSALPSSDPNAPLRDLLQNKYGDLLEDSRYSDESEFDALFNSVRTRNERRGIDVYSRDSDMDLSLGKGGKAVLPFVRNSPADWRYSAIGGLLKNSSTKTIGYTWLTIEGFVGGFQIKNLSADEFNRVLNEDVIYKHPLTDETFITEFTPNHSIPVSQLGNIHFGFKAREKLGLSDSEIILAETGAQILQDLAREGRVRFPQSDDKAAVQFGIDLYNEHGSNFTDEEFANLYYGYDTHRKVFLPFWQRPCAQIRPLHAEEACSTNQ
ncbi:MAG: N-acetylmuramoyl-L-alanine amidase [Chloroflexota bacterium]